MRHWTGHIIDGLVFIWMRCQLCAQVIVPKPVPGPSATAFAKTAARLQNVNLITCRTVEEAIKAAFGNKAKKKSPVPKDNEDWSDE